MPFDPTLGLRIALDSFWYNILFNLAGLHWGLIRGFIMMGHIVEMINGWLAENAFSPLIQMTNDTLQVAVSLAFVVALFVLAITYLMAAFVRFNVVSPRNAILWYLAGALFFGVGPSLYQGMNEFRLSISEGFYLSALSGIQGSAGSALQSLGQVQSNDLSIGQICDHLGVYLPNATGAGRIDGLDVALAYLRADGPDVMGYPQPLYSPGCPVHLINPLDGAYISPIPQEWYFPDSFFDVRRGPVLAFNAMSEVERATSIATASSSQGRLLTAWPLVLFGIVEQLAYLLITIAQGLTFVSFGIAILFAFFKRTEAIANSVINQWVELIIQTVIIALIQALVVAVFLAGTAANNGMVVLGIGLVCLVFMLITLWSGVKAIWNSFNRLFGAFSQAAGGTILSPAQAGGALAATSLLATGGAVALGSNALAGVTSLQSGATPAQAAGLALGGVTSLSSSARTLAYLPGLRNTSLGEAAEQFVEGAVVRRVGGPMIGRMLLTDRDPDGADYDRQGRVSNRPMLLPAVGEGLEGWTTPLAKSRRTRSPVSDDATDESSELEGVFTPFKRKRTGLFTPVASQGTNSASSHEQQERERQTYVDDMRGEEMEGHISDVARSNSATAGANKSERIDGTARRLEGAADALENVARTLIGSLRVSGGAEVSSVMGDVMRLLNGQGGAGVDHFKVADLMARAIGVAPLGDGKPPVREDIACFGMFIDSAARLGLSPEQTERVAREVKESPYRDVTPELRTELINSAIYAGRSHDDAEREIAGLTLAAKLLPNEVTAYGTTSAPEVDVTVQPNIIVNTSDTQMGFDEATRSDETMAGRGAVLGGSG
jgi:hypothetical protein